MAEQTDIPTGHVGNLTAEQEAKLRDLWTIVFKFLDVYEAETEANPNGTNTQEAAAPAEKEKRGWFGRGSSKPKATTAWSNVTHHKYPNLIREVMAILPPEDRDNQELVKIAVEALDLYTPDTIRAIIRDCVKHEHPDALALRFLRARKWDLIRAVSMMAKTINWRVNDMKVDAELMKEGEGQAVEDEKTGSGFKKMLSADFLKQIRWGKSYIHGLDRMGRPVNYIRVKLHKASDQCNESIERYTVYLFELGRLALMPPLETATIVFDMTGFTLANMDYIPIKFLIQCFEANYPESLGACLIHNAPWAFKSIWRIIHGWLDPVVAKKVHFTNNIAELNEFIAPDQLIKELGGNEDWTYQYVEPIEGENDLMKDTATRDRLREERRDLAGQFELKSRQWTENPDGEKAEAIKAERDRLAKELADNFWKLDPYVRARSVYDRLGYFRGAAGTDWYGTKDAAKSSGGGGGGGEKTEAVADENKVPVTPAKVTEVVA